MRSATLQDDLSIEAFFNIAATETLASFEHLSFGFLEEFNVFTLSRSPGFRHRDFSSAFISIILTTYTDAIGGFSRSH